MEEQELENEVCMHLFVAADLIGLDSESYDGDDAQIAIMIKLAEDIAKRLGEIADADNPTL